MYPPLKNCLWPRRFSESDCHAMWACSLPVAIDSLCRRFFLHRLVQSTLEMFYFRLFGFRTPMTQGIALSRTPCIAISIFRPFQNAVQPSRFLISLLEFFNSSLFERLARALGLFRPFHRQAPSRLRFGIGALEGWPKSFSLLQPPFSHIPPSHSPPPNPSLPSRCLYPDAAFSPLTAFAPLVFLEKVSSFIFPSPPDLLKSGDLGAYRDFEAPPPALRATRTARRPLSSRERSEPVIFSGPRQPHRIRGSFAPKSVFSRISAKELAL